MNKKGNMNYVIILFLSIFLFGCTESSLKSKMKSLDDDTLLGPDRNNNGVRDDVEYFILERYSEKGSLVVGLLGMMVKNTREMQKHCNDPKKSIELWQEGTKYGLCLAEFLEPNNPLSHLMLEEIDFEIMRNTKKKGSL